MRSAVALLCLFVSGCSETVTFNSKPTGAKIYVDNGYVGDAPTTYATRDVIPRKWRAEKEGLQTQEGELIPHVAGGRVFSAIITLGIVRIFRPLHYYTDFPIEIDFGGSTSIQTATLAATVKLYDLATGDQAKGSCNSNGKCAVLFADNVRCDGEWVRETAGETTVESGARATTGSVGGYGYGSVQSGAGAARRVSNTQRGVAVLQCPGSLIDCELSIDAFNASGHGTCTGTDGKKYRMMLAPK